MNANRQLGLTTGQLSKSSEKLSSGYKINRAADDAAGLSISEKMRKQIRGLDQASENIEDGISLCQVADGALNETVSILQRMRELAVQSANGTNSASDREYIDMEITQLKNEVDRIAVTTSFNDAVYPLNAPITYSDTELVKVSGVADVTDAPSEYDPDSGLLRETEMTFVLDRACTYDGKNYNIGDTITIRGLTTNGDETWIFQGVKWSGSKAAQGWDPSHCVFNDMGTLRKTDLKIDEENHIYYEDNSGKKMYAMYFTIPVGQDPMHFEDYETCLRRVEQEKGRLRFMTTDDLGDKKASAGKKDITMQVTNYYFGSGESTAIHSGDSASQTNKIHVRTVNATCRGLGINDLTVATEDSATIALVLLNRAISKASAYRSDFGAVQNRLEHAQKIDDNTSENTQAAESQIRDTDMAAEMVRYSNVSILNQAGQSMLAQANQSRQGILSLIA